MVALQRFQALSRVVLHADENNHTVARRGDAVGVRVKPVSLAKPMQAQLRLDRALSAFLEASRNVPLEYWWSAGTAPLLVIQGLDDEAAPPGNGHALREQLGERVRVVDL